MTSAAGQSDGEVLHITSIIKGIEIDTKKKYVKITGTIHGHQVRLIVSSDSKMTRADLIKKIQSQGIKVTEQQTVSKDSVKYTGSIVGKKGKSVSLSFDTQSQTMPIPELTGQTIRIDKDRLVAEVKSQTTEASRNVKSAQSKGKGRAPEKVPLLRPSPLEIAAPLRPPPPAAAAQHDAVALARITEVMQVNIQTHVLYDDFRKAHEVKTELQSANPDTVIITQENPNPSEPKYTISIKRRDGGVYQYNLVIEAQGNEPEYKIKDTSTKEFVLGGKGFAKLDDCINELIKQHAAPAQAQSAEASSIRPPQQDARARVEPRASQLFKALQPFKEDLKQMGIPDHAVDGVLKDLCYVMATCELGRATGTRFRKNEAVLQELGVHFPFTFYLEKKPDPQGLNVNFIMPKVIPGAIVGSGTYKIVKTSCDLDIPSPGSSQRPTISISDTVLIRPRPQYVEHVRSGFEKAQRLLSRIKSKIDIAPIPVERTYTPRTPKNVEGIEYAGERTEFVQERFQGDIEKVIKSGTLPLNIAPNAGRKQFNIADKFNLLIDVGNTLSKFHAAGIVHRDIKPLNLLVKITGPEQRATGIVSDFDLIGEVRVSSHTSDRYAWWDPCSRKGIITTNSDVYGLVYTLGQTVFPKFYETVGVPERVDDRTFGLVMKNKITDLFTSLGLPGHPMEAQINDHLLNDPGDVDSKNGFVINKLTELLANSGQIKLSQVRKVRKMQAELTIMPQLWGTIASTINNSQTAYDIIKGRKDLRDALSSKDERVKQGARQEIDRIFQESGLPTAAQFTERLADLRDRLPIIT